MESFKHFRLRPGRNADGPAIVALVHGVLREYGLEPEPAGVDGDLPRVEEFYASGDFVVVEDGSGIVGTAGLLPLADGEVELRKMYLAPSARGHGLGRYLLERALRLARGRGYRRISLETQSSLVEAIGLYRSYGFKPICGGVHTCRCDLALVLELT